MHSVPNASLKVGDVITYANPQKAGTTVTHRIVETFRLYGRIPAFITKGDANPNPDKPVVANSVQGKVTWYVPYVGTWMSWTRTIVGISVIVYLPALIVIIDELRRLAAYYRKFMPYKSAIVLARERAVAARSTHNFAAISAISVVLLASSIIIAYPVQALLKSNTVALVNNHITVAPITPPNACGTNGNNSTTTINVSGGGSGNNNVNVSNTSNQTATSGNATVSGNTNGGNATSGNASNCNSTNINITIH